MKQRTDKARLAASMRAVLGQPINDDEAITRPIELLESIAWASYEAGRLMRDSLTRPMPGQEGIGGPNGHWLTDREKRAKYAASADEHDRNTERHLAELRALTGDDDAAWAKRLERIKVTA